MEATKTQTEIKRVRHARGVITAQLTRFSEFIKTPSNQDNIKQIEFRLKAIQKYFEDFGSMQSTLEYLDAAEAVQRESIENSFFENMAEAQTLIDKARSKSALKEANDSESDQLDPISNVRLPTINLPFFSGNYESWINFNDTFLSLIHNNKKISNIQKLYYLKSCLKDEAEKLVQSLEISADNYDIAYQLLKKRYENKRVIVNTHIKALFELPVVTRDSKNLRTIVDSVHQHISALGKMNLPTKEWDVLLIYLIVTKLDFYTKREWEQSLVNNDLPNLNQLMEFLTKKCNTLDSLTGELSSKSQMRDVNQKSQRVSATKYTQHNFAVTQNPDQIKCHYCQQNHQLFNCNAFIKLSTNDKYAEIRKLKLCSNCLRPGHFRNECKSSKCKKCNMSHNTVLHNDHFTHKGGATERASNVKSYHSPNNGNHYTETNQTQETARTYCASHATIEQSQVLLSTAQILIKDKYGKFHECRALLDSGSQSNLISQSLCNKLNLRLEDFCVPITGVNQAVTKISSKVTTLIKSRVESFQANITFLVLPNITQNLPLVGFNPEIIDFPKHLQLADPEFNISKEIDVLLGANIFYDLLSKGHIKLGKGKPVLQETKFGWVFSGSLSNQLSSTYACNYAVISNETLNDTLTKFWQIEDIPQKRILTSDEQYCEDYFESTTKRNYDGRFIVKLPFKRETAAMGNSKSTAIRRFHALDSRFRKNQQLYQDYSQFMDEYKQLGHMSPCSFNFSDNESYFLPHHAVIKQSSTTTKCRVVFDASAKSSTGISLNDQLLVGPVMQDDLFAIITRFRLRKYVLIADIKMMYRQILIHPGHRQFQLVLWRNNDEHEIKTYLLNTVTYGTACAPYLATRCLKQLAMENRVAYPKASQIIENSFYMDDLLLSIDTIPEALQIFHDITNILNSAGFQLRKWSSNEQSILQAILGNGTNIDQYIQIQQDKNLKALGIIWNTNLDTLHYSVNLNLHSSKITKRSVLSLISQIFDPLGMVGPAIIKAKIIMQKLWQLNIGWDDLLPNDLQVCWLTFSSKIHILNIVNINRHIVCENPTQIELHGFSDASEVAYGACIYIVSTNSAGDRVSNLLCAKSKVAPLKKLTLPRLELQAALLLTNLCNKIKQIVDTDVNKIRYYCDSTIVLAWLKLEPARLKTFVANRVSQIKELSNVKDWKHVKTENNAAEIISRGINPDELLQNEIWWHGPKFLLNNVDYNESDVQNTFENLPDIKSSTIVAVCNSEMNDFDIFKRYSSLIKLQHVIAYCFRFKEGCLKRTNFSSHILTVSELQHAIKILIKLSQREQFTKELNLLNSNKQLSNNSKLQNLQPFLDQDGIMRVGGRLDNSQLPYDQRHPIILCSKHILTKLIIQHEHLKNLHVGTQNLLSIIRLKYWPINGKNAVKKFIRSCIHCFRAKPKHIDFLMGELPTARVNPSRVFSNCGIDYAGPIFIKDGTLRKAKLVKAYICIFVCFSTRAIHIDLSKDLTTDSFLNVLKRFISRRGKPSNIFSDNGLNFIGAKNHFKELYDLFSSDVHIHKVQNFLSHESINWHFIPPKSPHMGGLWEAAVKSAKFHLRRVIGETSVTYEEMYTLLTQIEACLNSRPLTPLSNDPDDFLPLTPAHFIIGEPLIATPQNDVTSIKITRLNRYQHLQQMFQHFWKRWSNEYLNQLQQRSKWNSSTNVILQVGSLVVLVEDNVPPLRWTMARITALHPGKDQVVRVVSVKAPSGNIFKRSVAKICVLPIEDRVEENA